MKNNPLSSKKKLLLGLVASCVALFIGFVATYFVYSTFTNPPTDNFNTGNNGLWLGSKWYQGKVSDAEIAALAQRLKSEQIKYAYFHCRDINRDGDLRYPSFESATKLVKALHEQAPQVQVIAWVGAVNTHNGGDVDIAVSSVRDHMANAARSLITTCKFDGIQWDFEFCDSGNPYLLALLKQTREQLPSGSNLGVCASLNWTPAYITEVAKLADQIPVMAYDTTRLLPWSYVRVMDDCTIEFSEAVNAAKSKATVIMGVPTYEEPSLVHFPPAENLKMALVGVKRALSNPRCNRNIVVGIAPYADFTTDKNEWLTYDKFWLDR